MWIHLHLLPSSDLLSCGSLDSQAKRTLHFNHTDLVLKVQHEGGLGKKVVLDGVGTWEGEQSENSKRLWLFLGSLGEFCTQVPGKFREDRWKKFPRIAKSFNWRNPKGNGTENIINCRKLSQIVVTFYDEFYDDL